MKIFKRYTILFFTVIVCFFGCATNKDITTYKVIGLRTVLSPIENPNNFFFGSVYEEFSPTNILDGRESYDSLEEMLNSEHKLREGNFVEIASYSVNKKENDLYDFDILTMVSNTPKFGRYSFLDKNEIEAKTKKIRDENILTESSKYFVLGSEISKGEFDGISKYVLKSNKIIFDIIYLVDGNYIYVCLEGK